MRFKFNELNEAESVYKNGFTGTELDFGEAYLLAKYLRVVKGYGKTKIQKSINEYGEKQSPYFNDILEREIIGKVIRLAMKQTSLTNSLPVTISKTELEKINSIGGFEARKIMFVMLVIARAKKMRKPYESEKLFLDYAHNKQIKKLANVRAGSHKYNSFLYDLSQLKYMYTFVVHNYEETSLNMGILIADKPGEESEPAITVTDFDNILSYLPLTCPNCHKVLESKPKRRDICDECYKEQRKEDIRNNVKSHRSKKVEA
jgi:hypothetical protein